MAQKSDLMAGGQHAALASRLGFDAPSSALTATGSTSADALVLKGNYAIFGTVAASTGAILPAGHGFYFVRNGGASALTVYPPSGSTVNGTTSFSVTNAKSAFFIVNGLDIGAILSA
jgi:hypothetical protein